MSGPEPSDQELLRAMQQGDEEAFVSLYRRWQGPLYRFALQMSGSRAVAEDVTQETFLALMRDSRGYRASRGSMGAYLYGIARHLTLRALAREKPNADESDIERVAVTAPGAADPHQEALRNQRTERLWAAVLALPVHYREVVVMCELHEMDYADVAAALGCSVGTVRSRLHRGRALLTERLRSASAKTAATLKIEPDGCAI